MVRYQAHAIESLLGGVVRPLGWKKFAREGGNLHRVRIAVHLLVNCVTVKA